MAVYVLYVPTARYPVTGIEMEKFNSREVAANTLKRRNNTKRSNTFYVAEREARSSDAARGFWQQADRTGYMRVFLRYAKDPVPSLLDTPDEEWILEKGGRDGIVVRLPWMTGDEAVSASPDCLRVVPARGAARAVETTPNYEVRNPVGVKPVGEPCGACYVVPSVTGRCNCS